MRSYGTVKSWFSRGFGFIKPDSGDNDFFIHASEVLRATGRDTLDKGHRVSFEVEEDRNRPGRFRAVDVQLES